MTTHKLGGNWTDKKLNCVRDYAIAWAKIMQSNKDKGYIDNFVYVDAFSGSGSYAPKSKKPDEIDDLFDTEHEKSVLRKGSAALAMEVSPKFDKIHLIEKKVEFAEELEKLAGEELSHRIIVHKADANQTLKRLIGNLNRRDRALVFIDPYGCEVEWAALREIANSKIADVWYLAPTSGINRQLAQTFDKIESYKVDLLNRVLGTSDWKDHFYQQPRSDDLFGFQGGRERKASPQDVETFMIFRLNEIFAYVHKDSLQLKNGKNGHMFSLCFAVSNDSKAAQDAGRRIAKSVIKNWG